jgi:hypothetical protein
VDDFAALELANKSRLKASAAQLAWSIKAMLGHDGLSLKKFVAGSFWSDFQRMIGAWFDTSTFTVTMPLEKIVAALDILLSDEFNGTFDDFQLAACASLHGKIRWACLCTPLGDCHFLINIERQRKGSEPGHRRVKAWRHTGESEEMALAKGRNDLLIRRVFLEACIRDPRLASTSMVNLMTLENRMLVPGQSKYLVWLSGDFSVLGQSFGFEATYPTHIRLYSFLPHPEEIIVMLRAALNGDADKNGLIVVSTVLERQNKLMAEFQYRKEIAGRPCIVLDDNTGSVAAINSGYSRNVLTQVMQVVSSLRQSVDKTTMTAYYCNTHNMGIFDKTSRREHEWVARCNSGLEVPWSFVPPSKDAICISEWMPTALHNELPQLESLLNSLETSSVEDCMPPIALNAEEINEPLDASWQARVKAAREPIPHYMGSFGPMAYSTAHLQAEQPSTQGLRATFQQLAAANASADEAACFKLFDCGHEGAAMSQAAIMAGMLVTTGCGATQDIEVFESLTSRYSLGETDHLDFKRVPASHVIAARLDWSDSACADTLFRRANDMGALVVVYHYNADALSQVGGVRQQSAQHAARNETFGQCHYTKVQKLELHESAEARTIVVGVAFHDSVALKTPFEFRPAAHSDHEAPFLAGVAAPPEVMADVLSDIAVALFQAGINTDLEQKPDAYAASALAFEGSDACKQDAVRSATRRREFGMAPKKRVKGPADKSAREVPEELAGIDAHKVATTKRCAAHPTKTRKGFSLFRGKQRAQLIGVPVGGDELECMALKREELELSKYADSSKAAIRDAVRHWISFCSRFRKPRFLKATTPAEVQQTTQQAELFILYELATFDIKAEAVARKLWAVSQDHLAKRLPDPFRENTIIEAILADAKKLDDPAEPKVPVTMEVLAMIASMLDLSRIEDFVLHVGIRTALAFLMRLSEWAFKGSHTGLWKGVTFFDRKRRIVLVKSASDIARIHEMEWLFMSSKKKRWGDGEARSFFAMKDNDPRCVVRDVARLWLMGDMNPEHPVFSWDHGRKGVTRAQVSKILKEAAIAVGIPQADVSSHSLRIGGLCLMLAHRVPYENCKKYGRWASDCIRKYFWASTNLVEGVADRMWNTIYYSRVRGGGAVQHF